MKISIIGTGYVGLVSAVCFAESGHIVSCIDIDPQKIETLQKGTVPFYEPGLEKGLKDNFFHTKRLNFSLNNSDFTQLDPAKRSILDSEVIFIAVGTPSRKNGSINMSHFFSALEMILETFKRFDSSKNKKILVNKSTVPIGTAQQVNQKIIDKNLSTTLEVVSNPEFLREGSAIDDFFKPDRVIIGTDNNFSKNIMLRLYESLMKKNVPIKVMSTQSAEMTKYAANSFLATRISFINQIANLCELIGADVQDVKIGMGLDQRIGTHFLSPGVGYGGSCFPKDVQGLVEIASKVGFEFNLLKDVHESNNRQKLILMPKIKSYFKQDLSGKNITLWGLAFKPETDDIRESPAISMIDALLKEKANITVHDPIALNNVQMILGDSVDYSSDIYESVKKADALILMTQWNQYLEVDFDSIKEKMKHAVIFDGRNVLHDIINGKGFNYFSIGRAS